MAQEQQYGGFWARLIALILDNAIVFILLLAALLPLGFLVAAVGLEGPAGLAAWVLGTFVPFLYWPVLESSRWQATVGKRILGLQVTDADGGRMSFVLALMRSLAKIVSGIPLGLGFLLAAFTARKQALHDIIVKTVVVRSGPSHLWKLLLALLVGFALMVASAAGLFHYVLMPMFKKGFGGEDPVRVQMKSAPQAKAAPAPKAPAAPAPAVAGPELKVNPDPEFDAAVGRPLAGLDKPNSTRAGPGIVELSTVFPNNVVWVKFYLPMPPHGDASLIPDPLVRVGRVLDAAGNNFYDPGNTFEKDQFFQGVKLRAAKDPVPHLLGTRSVHVKPGLNEQTLQKIEGFVTYTAPLDPKTVAFGANEAGKEMPVHDSVVSLKSMSGNTAKLHFRGASENLLAVRGYGADGKALGMESRQTLPELRDVDDDFAVTFKAAPAKMEIIVAARVIDRAYAFSVARGAVAGPPESAAQGQTGPRRPRMAQAAPKPAAAAAAAPPQPGPKPAAGPEPKTGTKAEPPPAAAVTAAPSKPVSAPARATPRPRAEPQALPAPPQPRRQSNSGCVYKPVMTDEEIARCR